MGMYQDYVYYTIDMLRLFAQANQNWFGILTPQTANNACDDSLVPFEAISGNNAYGTDTNDEAFVVGINDFPSKYIGDYKYGLLKINKILINDQDHNSVYKLRFIWGYAGETMNQAIRYGQYTEVQVQSNIGANPYYNQSIDIMSDIIVNASCNVWVQAWNANNNSAINFFVGLVMI